MFIHNWKKEILTIPNMLSLLRLILIPVYVIIYLNASKPVDYIIAGGILSFSCLTDMIDGKIARQFNMMSTVGQILDPIADKLTQFTLMLCLSITHPVLRLVLLLFVVKEGFQGIVGLIYLQKGKILPGALPAGKICTTVLFLSLIYMILVPDLNQLLVDVIAVADTAFLCYAMAHYFFAYFGENAQTRNMDP